MIAGKWQTGEDTCSLTKGCKIIDFNRSQERCGRLPGSWRACKTSTRSQVGRAETLPEHRTIKIAET